MRVDVAREIRRCGFFWDVNLTETSNGHHALNRRKSSKHSCPRQQWPGSLTTRLERSLLGQRCGDVHVSIDYQALLNRILDAVDQRAYFTPTAHLDEGAGQILPAFSEALARPDFDPDGIRVYVHREFEAGRIDRVVLLSALHAIACHPKVAEWEEAARLAGEQELAALELGGPRLEQNLASVDRHRGVLAFLRGHYEVALDYFARAFERERSAENITNILCTMLRLGEEAEAWDLLREVRRAFPTDLVAQINRSIQHDPDLALLRTGDTE